MPRKMVRSDPLPPFGVPGVTIAPAPQTHLPRHRKFEKIHACSGVIWEIAKSNFRPTDCNSGGTKKSRGLSAMACISVRRSEDKATSAP